MTELYEYYQQLCRWLYAVPLLVFTVFVILYIVYTLYDKIKYKNRYVLASIFTRDLLIVQYFGENSNAARYKIGWDNNIDAPKLFLDTLDKTHTDATEEMSTILYPVRRCHSIYIYKLNGLGCYFVYCGNKQQKKTELVFPFQFAEEATEGVPYIPHFVCQRYNTAKKALLYPSDYRFKKQLYQDQMFLIQNTKNHESTKILDQLFENDAIIVPLHNITEMGAVVTVTNVAVHIFYPYQKDYHKLVEYTQLLKEALPRPQKSCPDYTQHIEFQKKLPRLINDFRAIDIPPLRNMFILALITVICILCLQWVPITNANISMDISEFFIPAFLLVFLAFDTDSLHYKIRRIWSFHLYTGLFYAVLLVTIVTAIRMRLPL